MTELSNADMFRKGKGAESAKKRRMTESPEQVTPPSRGKGRGKSADPPGPSGVKGKRERNIHQEKDFMETGMTPFYEMMTTTHQGQNLIEDRTIAVEDHVRAFYEQNRIGSEEGVYAVNIPGRGPRVLLSPVIVRQYYDLPLLTECEYEDGKDYIDLECRTQISTLLCDHVNGDWFQRVPGEGNTWYLRKRHMSFTTKIWLSFVTSNLMPSGHSSEIADYVAFLIYCLMSGKRVRFEKIILESISAAAQFQNHDMTFPHLISDRYRALGAPDPIRPRLLHPVGYEMRWLVSEFTRAGKPLPDYMRDEEDMAADVPAEPIQGGDEGPEWMRQQICSMHSALCHLSVPWFGRLRLQSAIM